MRVKWKIVCCMGSILLFSGTGCSKPTVEDVQEYCPVPLPASTHVIEFTVDGGIDVSRKYILSFSPEEYQRFKKSWDNFTKTHKAPFSERSSDPAAWTYKWYDRYIQFEFDDARNQVTGHCFTM